MGLSHPKPFRPRTLLRSSIDLAAILSGHHATWRPSETSTDTLAPAWPSILISVSTLKRSILPRTRSLILGWVTPRSSAAVAWAVALRLERIHSVARATGHLARFIVFGSFVTAKPDPNDVDIFMLMDDAFDAGQLTGEERLLFDHAAAQAHFGASVFWLRRLAAWEGEQAAVEYWQVTRGGGHRGIVEVIVEEP